MIQYRSILTNELINLENELRIIKPTFKQIRDKIEDEEIGVGSRVLCTWTDGPGGQKEGRVLNVTKSNKFHVNRDGYAGIASFFRNQLQNLSVGSYGKLERRIWQIENRIEKIKTILSNSEIPEILNKFRFNYIKVIDINDSDRRRKDYINITFIHSKEDISRNIKLPVKIITELTYYQVEMVESDIKEILLSTKDIYDKNK